jgi:uncharacterized phiE125 gp8 family phage protein
MACTLITPPALEPLTISEVKSSSVFRLDSASGEPAPTAPVVALAAPAAPGNVTAGVHRYLVTFVTADGETEAGIVSAAVTVADPAVNGQVALTAIPTGGAAVTARKLYRTSAGGSLYLLLATLANNTATTYTDNIADGSLGVQAPTTNTTADPELVRKLSAARRQVERITRRALVSQTWELQLNGFPCGASIELPYPPLVSVISVTYKDTSGAWQTLAATEYVVTSPAGPTAERGVISLAFAKVWPNTYDEADVVKIRFAAGYGATAASVPEDIREAILMVMSDLFCPSRDGKTYKDTIEVLLSPYRSVRW